jgi:hypothetical protein
MVFAIDREQILHQVVRPDREEFRDPGNLVDLEEERGDFDHEPEPAIGRKHMFMRGKIRLLPFHNALCALELVEGRHHRKHDLERAAGGGLEQGPDLQPKQGGPIEPDADRAPTQRRVLLLHRAHIGQDLVPADIEGAKGDRLVADCREHGPVERLLLACRRHSLRDHELQLGAE